MQREAAKLPGREPLGRQRQHVRLGDAAEREGTLGELEQRGAHGVAAVVRAPRVAGDEAPALAQIGRRVFDDID